MITEITQLKQKILALLREVVQLKNTLEENEEENKNAFILFIMDWISFYDATTDATQRMTMLKLLKKHEVLNIPVATLAADTEYARIVGTVEKPDRRNGIVTEIIKEGFTWKQNVIRKAEVIVVKN